MILLLANNAFAAPRENIEVKFQKHKDYIALFDKNINSEIIIDNNSNQTVQIAAKLLNDDFNLVTGSKNELKNQISKSKNQIIIGIYDQSEILGKIIKEKKIDISQLKDCFECYRIEFIKADNNQNYILIIGADRRGAAYGAIELSRAIGVSPWIYWADVEPIKRSKIYINPRNVFFQTPSIKYRGLFINDEDWGLYPWAKKNDPTGNIGPQTYEKVFELMLRLRANTLWPAMHEVTIPFNNYPENAALADKYGIIMGSSHAEPMLRNNVGEWTDKKENFNFATNPEGVKKYWRERLEANSKYENLYTIGMRGIHDSPMLGAKTLEEKQRLLNKVIETQQDLIKNHTLNPEKANQIFVPYKEVLEVYEAGVNIPKSAIIVWPDDNFGYIRRFPSIEERLKYNGFGVYYHLSYLGNPLAYIWLSTIPPELIKQEMVRAYDNGAKDFWVFNIGDIKPMEVSLNYSIDLAWDIDKYRNMSQKEYLNEFAQNNFGSESKIEAANLLNDYFNYNFERKPEHLQYHLGKETPKLSGLSLYQRKLRIEKAYDLINKTKKINNNSDGFFEIIKYPVLASAYANLRFHNYELEKLETDKAKKQSFADNAVYADEKIKEYTHYYNKTIKGGKWDSFIQEEPADSKWSFRIKKLELPKKSNNPLKLTKIKAQADAQFIYFANNKSNDWQVINDLGVGGSSIKALKDNAKLEQKFHITNAGKYCVSVNILAIFPTIKSEYWNLDLKIHNAAKQLSFKRPMVADSNSGKDYFDWQQGVLNNYISQKLIIDLNKGENIVSINAPQKDIILNRLELKQISESTVCN